MKSWQAYERVIYRRRLSVATVVNNDGSQVFSLALLND